MGNPPSVGRHARIAAALGPMSESWSLRGLARPSTFPSTELVAAAPGDNERNNVANSSSGDATRTWIMTVGWGAQTPVT